MKTTSLHRGHYLLIVFLCLILIVIPAAAKNEGAESVSKDSTGISDYHPVRKAYEPITKIDLGVKNLELEVGEKYTFDVSYKPKEPYYYALKWFITNDSVISIDPLNFELTALAPGSARILAESLDGVSYDVCNVTVNGKVGKDASMTKSGSALASVPDADRSKISAKSVKRYLKFIENSDFNASSYENAENMIFSVSAHVTPGTEKAETTRALSLGMEKAKALENLNVVNLRGTLEQILAFTADNPNLKEIFELDNSYLTDPSEEFLSDDIVSKALNLKGKTESLTAVSKAHDLGYKGNGTTIAVVDTGLDSSHKEFGSRVIYEHCFSTNYNAGKKGEERAESACQAGKEEYKSALPDTYVKSAYNHGSHTTGIAAGIHGIAPKAKIVAVQVFSDYLWRCSNSDISAGYYFRTEKNRKMCFDTVLFYQNELEAYDWLLSIQNTLKNKGKPEIAAVNMSYGSGAYKTACDKDDPEYKSYFTKLVKAGMIPVAAAGNEGMAGSICTPACISNVYAVGALYNSTTPKIASYSNHSKLVDILAPGTEIWSSFLAYEDGTSAKCTNGNCYGFYSGTSMATPMVTGAFAILKQAFPNQTVAEYEKLLKDMSPVRVNYRLGNPGMKVKARTFSFNRKVLNFTRIKKYINMNLESSVTKLTAITDANMVILNTSLLESHDGVQYKIYLESSDKLVKTITVEKGDENQIVTGLEKGKSYYVTAAPYRTYQNIMLKGPDSDRVSFVQ